MADDLLALGVEPGGLLLVHSSLSSMGRVAGGPATVIAGLRQADVQLRVLTMLVWANQP